MSLSLHNKKSEYAMMDELQAASLSNRSSGGYTTIRPASEAVPSNDNKNLPILSRRTIPKMLSAVIIYTDLLMMAVAFYAAMHLVEFIPQLGDTVNFDIDSVDIRKRFYFYSALCMMMVAAFANKGHYTQRVPWWGQVQFILKTVCYALVIDGFTYFSLQHQYSRFSVIATWGMATAFILAGRYLSLYLVSKSKSWKLPVVLVGTEDTVVDSMYAFYADGMTGYEVKVTLLCGQVDPDFNFDFLPKEHPPISIYAANGSFDTYIMNNPGYFYVISLDSFRGERRDRLMQVLEETGVEYAIIPPINRLHLHGMEPHYFFGNDIMLLHKRRNIEFPLWKAVKRMMDIAISGCALLVLGVLIPIVYVMKVVEGSESPMFYNGKRVGKKGKLFPCWKFCTMKNNADLLLEQLMEKDPALRTEWDMYKKLKNDPRIDSSISALLRKTSLDELPQLWNVFIGDMSLVGPRPILPEQREEYGQYLKNYNSVRPGLTGLWQVSGRNETSFQRRIFWDSWYIRNWSVWHDIVILFKTAKVLVTRSGAY